MSRRVHASGASSQSAARAAPSQATISRRCAEALQAGLIENVGHGRTRRYSAIVEPGDDETVLPRVVTSPVGDRVIGDRAFGEIEAA